MSKLAWIYTHSNYPGKLRVDVVSRALLAPKEMLKKDDVLNDFFYQLMSNMAFLANSRTNYLRRQFISIDR